MKSDYNTIIEEEVQNDISEKSTIKITIECTDWYIHDNLLEKIREAILELK